MDLSDTRRAAINGSNGIGDILKRAMGQTRNLKPGPRNQNKVASQKIGPVPRRACHRPGAQLCLCLQGYLICKKMRPPRTLP